MKKRYLIAIIIFCLVLNAILITTVFIPMHNKKLEEKKEEQRQEQIKNATIKVVLKEDLNVSFLSDKRVEDFIEEINGEITDNFKIDTSKVGEQKIEFEYVNEEDILIPYSYSINVVDDIPPVIWLGGAYTIYSDYKGNLLEDIVCADNYDDNPTCEIIGDYNQNKIGKYNLTFKATDASNNVTEQKFTLNVVKRPTSSGGNNNTSTSSTKFEDVIANYKTDKTKIGIDVSSWQGDIDFEKVKEAGVEFVFIRVGSSQGIKGDYFVDKKFVQNIEGFNKVGIPVGIYYYSYANSEAKAKADALWVLEQIKGYKVDLPVVYDWESWSFYNEFHQSFYSLTKSAKVFLDTVSEAGYDGSLYSSKNYLEKVWYDTGYPIWLAHYTKQTSYQGDYRYWQLCNNGKIPGINGYVDIDIMYE